MQYCITQRVRSVSELAREAILLAVQSGHSEAQLITGDLTALGSSLREIDLALNKLSGKISKILGSPRKSERANSASAE